LFSGFKLYKLIQGNHHDPDQLLSCWLDMLFLLYQFLVLIAAGQNAVTVAIHNGQSSLEESSVLIIVTFIARIIRNLVPLSLNNVVGPLHRGACSPKDNTQVIV
jgi:hypothetical protein